MTSGAKAGQGSLLKVGDGATPTETFSTIGEVLDIKGPKIKNAFEDVTSHDSTAGIEEFIATFTSLDEVTFDMNHLPANSTQSYAAGILNQALNRTAKNFRLYPANQSSIYYAFTAYVSKWELELPVKGVQKASCALKPTGALIQG